MASRIEYIKDRWIYYRHADHVMSPQSDGGTKLTKQPHMMFIMADQCALLLKRLHKRRYL
jgi:hypothetical protein